MYHNRGESKRRGKPQGTGRGIESGGSEEHPGGPRRNDNTAQIPTGVGKRQNYDG